MCAARNPRGRLPASHPLHLEFGRILNAQIVSLPLITKDKPEMLSFTRDSWRRIAMQFQRGLPPTVNVSNSAQCWCLTFTAARGYPTIHVKITGANIDKRINAHRLIFKLFHPEAALVLGDRKQQVSHVCGNTACVNPSHLVLESDKANKQRNYCRNGAAHLCPHNPKCIFPSV